MGSYMVVVNAEKVIVTGDKFNQKLYRRHTGRPGSMKEESFRHLQAVRPGHGCGVRFNCRLPSKELLQVM